MKKFISLFVTCVILASCNHDGASVELYALMSEVNKANAIYDILGGYFLMSSWYALGTIALALLGAYLLYAMEKSRWNGFWNFFERNLSFLFVLTWGFGFCVYTVGMFILEGGGDAFTPTAVWHMLGVAPMAIIHAFGMFLLESDISAIHEEWHGNIAFMTCYSLAHFAAAFVSMVFVVKHFGYNIVAGMRLWLAANVSRTRERLFVFWGMNEASFLLASDIENKRLATNKEKSSIIFVKTSDDNQEVSERNGLDRLFSLLSMKNKELEKYKTLHCLTTNSFNRLSKVDTTDETGKQVVSSVLRDALDLRSLVKLIGSTTREVHIFMLGDDEDSNIKATANICRDADIQKALKTKVVKVYSHARANSIKRVVEDINYSNPNLDVRIVDSAHMAVEQLKTCREPLTHPVHFVDVNQDATVTSSFRAMVIGMGQCGSDAVKFLYEHGAFVSPYSDEEGHVERSSFCCDVFDLQMDSIGHTFRHTHPAVSMSEVLEEVPVYDQHLVRLFKTDINDNLFWDFVEDHIAHENYIVITIKDDEAGISLAVRLLRHAIRRGNDLKRLRIFVRSYSHELLPHIEEIARFYNRHVAESLGLHDINPEPICIFGQIKTLYTYANIVDDGIRKESYRYFNSYDRRKETEENLGTAWRERRAKEMTGPNGLYWNLNSIRRKESQDIANALHRNVKTELLRKALGSEDLLLELASLIATKSIVRGGTNLYGGGYRFQDVLDTLAKTEHLRWNASHEMMGYTLGECKDEIRFTHNCLTTWEELDSDVTRGYDYAVVETSLFMYFEETKQKQ